MPVLNLAQQINEFRGPQPADCLAVNTERLTAALKASGPVVHLRQVWSLGADGKPVAEARPYAKVAATTTTDAEGNEHTTPEREPTDDELAAEWKLPTAASVKLGAEPAAASVTNNPILTAPTKEQTSE